MTMNRRYDLVAMALHWLLAVSLIGMVFYGWYMEGLREAALSGGGVSFADVQAAYNGHKTFGMIILSLSLVRLGWRLTHTPPALPAGMKNWERRVASATHWAFYALMIGMPLGGWLGSSASPFPSLMFNNPDLVLPKLPIPQDEVLETTILSLHGAGGWAILLLTALHAGAALKHQFVDRDNLLARMIPFLKD